MLRFSVATEVITGEGSTKALAELVRQYGRRVLIVTDRTISRTTAFKEVKETVEGAGVNLHVVCDVTPEPTADTVEEAFVGISNDIPQVVIAVGGGSVIDVAKALCILFTNGGSISEYDGTDVYSKRPLPLIAIPTTAGTGSEMSTSLNVTDTRRNAKLSVRHRWNRATVAILDPKMMAGIPRQVAVFPAIDAVTHALEAYVSREANPFSDAYAIEALRLFGDSFEPFLANTSDLQHGQAMQIGAAMAGVAFSSARTGYVHCLARAIGGRIKLPHGHAIALALPAVLEFNAQHASVRLAEVARLLLRHSFGAIARSNDADAVAALVDYIRGFAPRYNFPSTLSALGLKSEDLPGMVAYATELKYERWNPRAATQSELHSLLQSFF